MTSFELAPLPTDHRISYPSKGPVLDEYKRPISNGHSILTDVNGKEVWLHAEQHECRDGRVHTTLAHALDMGLPVPKEIERPANDTAQAPDSQPQQPTKEQLQAPSEVTQSNTALAPQTPASPSKKTDAAPINQDKK